MATKLIAILIISPFVAAFIYAGIHEYRRYKNQGPATYGLVHDEETGTTHLTAIAEGEEAYDPEDYNPSDYNQREDQAEDEAEQEADDQTKQDRDIT
jgi:hypothetical protein